MPTKFRIASFNAENLFRRAKVFTLSDPAAGDDILKSIELSLETSETSNKTHIFISYCVFVLLF